MLASLLLLGCGAGASSALPESHDTSDTDTPSVDAILSFDDPTSLEIAPGETREITLNTSPPDTYEIYVALLDAPSDTSLDASHLYAGPDGRATVKLHAPSAPASFTVHAWINNGPSADLAVSVSKLGVGAIEVIPDYDGPRPVTEWVASVIAGTTCDALAGQLPGEPEGAFVAVAPAPQYPLIQSVPVGPKLAVAVRAGHFAWGCTDAHDIPAGGSTSVKVHVVDVPPRLEQTKLDLAFEYAPESGPYAKMLGSARSDLLGAFFPPQKPLASALLDAMAAASADPASFEEERALSGWDTAAQAHFDQLAVPLPDLVNKWIDLGLAGASPELTGQIDAIEGVPGKALFYASRIGGLDAMTAGAPPVHLLSLTAGPDDKAFLSGSVYFLPSRFIGAAAEAGAEKDLMTVDTMADALAQAAACDDLATDLGPTPACDAACLADLCRAGLQLAWQAAIDASAQSASVATIDIGASGVFQVDDTAVPTALTGTWLGKVSAGGVSASVTGNVTGIAPPSDKPSQDPPPGGPQ